jgi:BlaI family transcriptional regulator, penicillinase repressor
MLPEERLSRREREVMEILHRRGAATAAEIRGDMGDPPSDAAVRSTLRILAEKGHVRFAFDGPRYVYRPSVPRDAARHSALENVLSVFFDGSAEGAVAALLEMRGRLTPEEKARLKALIDRADEEGR